MARKKKRIIAFEELQKHFYKPLPKACRDLKVSGRVIRNSLRSHGLQEWPYRRLKDLSASIDFLNSFLSQLKSLENRQAKGPVASPDQIQRLKDRFLELAQTTVTKNNIEAGTNQCIASQRKCAAEELVKYLYCIGPEGLQKLGPCHLFRLLRQCKERLQRTSCQHCIQGVLGNTWGFWRCNFC